MIILVNISDSNRILTKWFTPISEAPKMSRLLQFLDGPARSAVAGFEGVPGGLGKALKMLQ